MREKAMVGEGTFALTADVSEAHYAFSFCFFKGCLHSGRSKGTRVTVATSTKVLEFVKLILQP